MERITSLQNERVKKAIKLRDRKGRERQSRIAIDGVREIRRALDAKVEILEVFTCEPLIKTPIASSLLELINDVRVEVSEPVWEKLAFGNRKDGILAIATPPISMLDDIPNHDNAFIVILDSVEKPGNVGAVVRTADGAGVDGVILTNAATDTYNPNAIRASLGTLFSLPVVTANFDETMAWLKQRKIQTHVSIVNSSATVYSECDFSGSTALVFGSEASGVNEQWITLEDGLSMYLPMFGSADSLNVSAATAAVLYEVVRQRT